jgi:hypothetical protein
MVEFLLWSGVQIAMLLNLLAIISSTALLAGAICEIGWQHVGGRGFAGVFFAAILSALNFFIVRRAGLSLANATRGKPEAVQARYGKGFSIFIFVWAVCAAFLGTWITRLFESRL